MTDYVELLVGEVMLGDLNNTYLYVGEDLEAQQLALGTFIRRVGEEGQQLTTVVTPMGKVVVNGTQRFMFIHKNKYECAIVGMSFNRIFVDIAGEGVKDRVKRSLASHLAYHDGDFV